MGFTVSDAETDAAAGFLDELAALAGDEYQLFAEMVGPVDHLSVVLNEPLQRSMGPAVAVVGVAFGPAAARRCWDQVIGSRHAVVRGAAAWSADTPGWVLAALASDPSGYVRDGVASNPATPTGCLATLAGDVNVAEQLLSNPSSTRAVLDGVVDALERADRGEHTPWLALQLARDLAAGDADLAARIERIEAGYRAAHTPAGARGVIVCRIDDTVA